MQPRSPIFRHSPVCLLIYCVLQSGNAAASLIGIGPGVVGMPIDDRGDAVMFGNFE